MSKISKAKRLAVYNKFDGHCAYCGRPLAYNEMQVDHMVSKYRDGGDELSNLMPSCRSCNFRKGVYDVEAFRAELRRQAANMMKTFQARQSKAYGLVEYHDHPITFFFEQYAIRNNQNNIDTQ